MVKERITIGALVVVFVWLFTFIEDVSVYLKKTVPLISTVSPYIGLLSLAIAVLFGYQRILSSIGHISHETYKKVLEVISPIKGEDANKKETDIIRKLLQIQVGEDIAEILLPRDISFPITLVPSGNIGLIMDQAMYGELLMRVITSVSNWKVKWTTFVPFESLNRGFSYNITQWENRMKEDSLSFVAAKNEKFYDIVSQWNKIKNSQQIIILANPLTDPIHPLNWKKYIKNAMFNMDAIKYLSVRYGIVERDKIVSYPEDYFLGEEISKEVIKRDEDTKDVVRWISTVIIRGLIRNIGIEPKEIHGLDFIYCSEEKGNRFCLVRIDPANYLEVDGGVTGTTFIIVTARDLDVYYRLFTEMWGKAVPTFGMLTSQSL